MSQVTFQKAKGVREAISAAKGQMPAVDRTNEETKAASRAKITNLRRDVLTDMKTAVQQLDAMRTGAEGKRPLDMSFGEYSKLVWGFSPDEKSGSANSLFSGLNIDYGVATIDFLMSQNEMNEGYRWLVPEIIREAVRLGMRRPAFYPNILAAEENVAMPKISMPYINMSDATPTKIGEAETIPTGMLSFGQKDVKIQKIGVGMKYTDEVLQYTAINLLAIYLQDMGVKMNLGLDIMAIDVLINGDGNSNAAGVMGVVDTTKGIQYQDLLSAWFSMGLLGRMPQSILGNKTPAINLLMLPDFRQSTYLYPGFAGQNQVIRPRTPLPTAQALDIHGAMPTANQLMLIDATGALIKFNSNALRMENERIAERQISGTYATMTTGFANLYRDARLILDGSLAIGSYPLPTWMDATTEQAAASFRIF